MRLTWRHVCLALTDDLRAWIFLQITICNLILHDVMFAWHWSMIYMHEYSCKLSYAASFHFFFFFLKRQSFTLTKALHIYDSNFFFFVFIFKEKGLVLFLRSKYRFWLLLAIILFAALAATSLCFLILQLGLNPTHSLFTFLVRRFEMYYHTMYTISS